MTRLLAFEHRGVRAAIPASQALDVVAQSGAVGETATLWTGCNESGERWLRLRALDAEFWIKCHSVELCEIASDALTPLSAVVSGALRLPHVVGLAKIAEHPTWLVDMTRFRRREL